MQKPEITFKEPAYDQEYFIGGDLMVVANADFLPSPIETDSQRRWFEQAPFSAPSPAVIDRCKAGWALYKYFNPEPVPSLWSKLTEYRTRYPKPLIQLRDPYSYLRRDIRHYTCRKLGGVRFLQLTNNLAKRGIRF